MAKLARKAKPPKPPREKFKYGIAEWLGYSFVELPVEARHQFADEMLLPKNQRPAHPCPFMSHGGTVVNCTKIKDGAVCSTRLYRLDTETGKGETVPGVKGLIRALCPDRFQEGGYIFEWIGHVILGHRSPRVVGQVPYLQRSIIDVPAGNAENDYTEDDFKDRSCVRHTLARSGITKLDLNGTAGLLTLCFSLS